VREGLARRPESWRWSSFAATAREGTTPRWLESMVSGAPPSRRFVAGGSGAPSPLESVVKSVLSGRRWILFERRRRSWLRARTARRCGAGSRLSGDVDLPADPRNRGAPSGACRRRACGGTEGAEKWPGCISLAKLTPPFQHRDRRGLRRRRGGASRQRHAAGPRGIPNGTSYPAPRRASDETRAPGASRLQDVSSRSSRPGRSCGCRPSRRRRTGSREDVDRDRLVGPEGQPSQKRRASVCWK
jgi:hypothetical protein